MSTEDFFSLIVFSSAAKAERFCDLPVAGFWIGCQKFKDRFHGRQGGRNNPLMSAPLMSAPLLAAVDVIRGGR